MPKEKKDDLFGWEAGAAALLREGRSVAEVAEKVGVHQQRVYRLVRSREDLTLPRRGGDPEVRSFQRQYGLRLGSLGPALKRADREVTDWLVTNTPEGATIADTVVALVLDTYHEEQDSK